ncbi:acetolactate synthase-1/2/3 large subunit [Salirhabdus euzebyi]|uniref:Acetolactate synthase-1/2/3 large subunit n=1 Tax=Salirhabdus euzebyi TaxID=394506 RepID=A0A841Q852_9BACI|nr:thiamine pyrophosphate-binding protein [Salirhabdus euzebyi]MBB6454576.1 acetolactate synthase-1/2/3 large subunit [Salirhabdus euzebyi]
MERKAVDVMCDLIEEAEIEYVFGIQGGITYRLFNALGRRGKVKLIIARHEQSAAIMAATYGRLTGKPAILMGQGPFIASSGGFGIIEAYLSGYPLIVISDAVTNSFGQKGMIQSGSGEYGSFDLLGILRKMTKYTGLATTPKQAIQGLQQAIKHACTDRKGPAGLVIYQPEVYEEFNENEPPYLYGMSGYICETQKSSPNDEQIKKAFELIGNAERPVIIAGNGIHMSNSYAELKEFCELTSIPVATSYRGKSVLNEDHPLALGMLSDYGQLVANTIVGEADLIISLGCRLGPSDTAQENPALINPQKQKIIQVDIDPHRAGWTFPIDLSLIGDLKATLQKFNENASSIVNQVVATQRKERVQKYKKELGYFEDPFTTIDSSPVYPQRIIGILNEVLPKDAFLMTDAGTNRAWTAHLYQSKTAGSVVVPGGIAGMGSGPPAAVATKIVNPDKCVVAVVGDGGMAMTANSISTSVQHNCPVVLIVMNDSRLGMPSARQGKKTIATHFTDTNFADIAKGYGAKGVRIKDSTQFKSALIDAINSNVTTVLDVIIDVERNYTKEINAVTEKMKKYKKVEANPYDENAFF